MKRKDKKIIITLLSIVAILIIGGMFVPISVSAPSDTRTIIDHTTQTYAAPSCFDQAEMTNFLQETTFGHAQTLDYDAESLCSSDFYTQSDVPIFFAMLQLFGLGEEKWTEEDRL
ncbi:hypothetical protein DH09_04120 [Bacillaceae bacterium JMAK1]|nr:hypothetical protein DH09_04120 [Bacillaceae bacterium JMAK1]